MGDFEVVVAAGLLSSAAPDAVHFPHRWTPGGVTVNAVFSGAHLLHLAAAGAAVERVHRSCRGQPPAADGSDRESRSEDGF